MSPVRAARVRSAIRSHRASALTEVAGQALRLRSGAEVTRWLRQAFDEMSFNGNEP
jgi:phosphoenolpyruvate-protein kinase (PTS system EI component)